MNVAEMEVVLHAAFRSKDSLAYIAENLTAEEATQIIIYLNLRRMTRGIFRRDH